MAITNNTDFTSGQILTAQQQNNFPRGIMAISKATATDATITVLEETFSVSFTAVANRNYRVTYFEPEVTGTSGAYTNIAIFVTSIALSANQIAAGYVYAPAANSYTSITVTAVGTFTAGTVVIKGAASASAGTSKIGRAATQPAFLMVEDIGTA
jgi:phenylacetate-coenzyme A ligase PaaK-like adenylate-forming protein